MSDRIGTTDPLDAIFEDLHADVARPLPDRAEVVHELAKWFAGLSPEARASVRWAGVATLREHPACDFLPVLPRSQAQIKHSVERHGVLFPLGVAADGRVLDGRYRLRAARELGVDTLPVLTIDVEREAAVRWVFELKDGREHLGEAERAMMAVQYPAKLSGDYVKARAAKMNDGRRKGEKQAAVATTSKRRSPSPKKDSRKQACEKFKVPVRTFNAMKRLSSDRPDLYEQVLVGKLDPAAAIKRKGKNGEVARVQRAKELLAQAVTLDNPELENNIHCGDTVEVMRRVPDAAASLVMFSPPYPGVPVEYDPPLPPQTYAEYLDYQCQLLVESFRVSRRGGRLAIVIDTVKNREGGRHFMLPVVADLTKLAIECGWGYFNDIAWFKDEISGSKTNFGSLAMCSAPVINRNHETILLFVKETHKLEGNASLCDLSREEHLKWWTSAWHIKPELDKTIRTIHKAPFPEEIPHRLIKMLTYGRDLVIDPYNGSGTTTIVARQLGRRYIGIDQSEGYCAFARRRH